MGRLFLWSPHVEVIVITGPNTEMIMFVKSCIEINVQLTIIKNTEKQE